MNTIGDFKGVHKGKRIFILASGPSLNGHDLFLCKNRMVMGLNRSFLAWRDTYYHCAMDQRLFEEYAEELKKNRRLFTLEGRPFGTSVKPLGSEGFSTDLEEGIYSGYTISYVALQIACYMGFSEIYYLGLDLKLKGKDTHFFGRDFRSAKHDVTEFPKMNKMLTCGAKKAEEMGVKVFNCSPDTDLDCFPYIAYEKAVAL